jgi:hypothetical protein
VLAAKGAHVLIDPKQVPAEFFVDYLIGITLAAQRDMLPIHGASVLVGHAGVVLAGASHAGKTTTALHLAARGHPLLGDEVALLRGASNEIVPFRRAANLRPGPYGAHTAAVLGFQRDGASDGGQWTGLRRISEVFPGIPARPAPLRAMFFLGGFARRASLEPFRLTVDRGDVFEWLTMSEIAQPSWGLEPARRALRLFALREALARVPCWLLKLGPPQETTDIIERTMEELQC